MQSRKVGIGLTSAFLALVLVAAACGSDDKSAETPSSSGASISGTSAPSAQTTAGGGDVKAATQTLYDAAKKEKKRISFYSTVSAATTNALGKRFNELYPDLPGVDALQMAATALPVRFAAESDAGSKTGDIVLDAYGNFPNYVSKKYVAPLQASDIPELAAYNQKFILPWGAICSFGGPAVVTYNKNIVGDHPPKDLADLLDPKYKGKISLGNPDSTSTLYSWYAQEQAAGIDFLKEFAKQNPAFHNSSFDAGNRLAAGEIAAMYPGYPGIQNALASKGAPVASVATSVLSGPPAGCGMSSHTQSPATAKLFLNFLMSELGQSILNLEGGQATMRPGVPAMEGRPKPVYAGDFVVPDQAKVEAARAEIKAALGAP